LRERGIGGIIFVKYSVLKIIRIPKMLAIVFNLFLPNSSFEIIESTYIKISVAPKLMTPARRNVSSSMR
jgi:hypothetical protein